MGENPGNKKHPRLWTFALFGDELESHIGHVRGLPVGAVEAELGLRGRETVRRVLGILGRGDVPFARIPGFVAGVAERLGNAFDRGTECDTVAHHAIEMGILSRHQAGTIGTTDGRVRHRGVQPGALPGEGVENRRAGIGVAVAAHGIRPLHVGEDKQDIRPACETPAALSGTQSMHRFGHIQEGRGQSHRPHTQEGAAVQYCRSPATITFGYCRRALPIHWDLTQTLRIWNKKMFH